MDRFRWAILLAAFLGSSAAAQSWGQTLGGSWVGLDLAGNPTVAEELKLDPDQKARAKELIGLMHGRRKDLIARLEGLGGEERAKAALALAASLSVEEQNALAKILDHGQLARFHQLDLQQRGASALLDPNVGEALGLAPDQFQAVQRLLDRSILRRREAQSNTRGDRRASTVKIQAIRRETDAQALEVLTSDQRAKWKAITGEPLDLEVPSTR